MRSWHGNSPPFGVWHTGGRRGNPFASLMAKLQSGAAQLIAHPLDYGSMFIDRAGTTPVTAPGQQVGRVLDVGGGNFHATAVSDAARGFFGIVPDTGRRNLLTHTEAFDNAVWNKLNVTVTTNTTVAPDGTTTADTIAFNGTFDARVEQNASVASQITLSVWLRVASGSVSVSIGTRAANTVSVNVTGEWQRFSMTATDSAFPRIRCDVATNVFAWGAQLEVGSTATAYQRVGSQFDVTEAGVRSLSYMAYNGVNTAYQTPVLPAPGVDKAQVFAGVRKLSDASAGVVLELSTSTVGSVGSFYLITAENMVALRYTALGRGDASVNANQRSSHPDGPAPDTCVLTATHDIPADLSRLRRNGVFGTDAPGDKGTGNFNPLGTYRLNIGSRNGTSVFFNGHHYGTLGPITRFGTNATADQIAAAEAYYTGATGL